MFVPPINLGQFQPSPATLADWIYQIWNYLQNNPIATQEQLQEYIATFITTSPETQELIGEGVEQYLTDNPPEAPVQSVQGKTGAVTLAFNDILKNNNTAPVYRAASMPSQSTLQAQYNLGYRLFVNTSTQEIYSITNTGGTTLVGKGKFDGTDIDLDTAQGDTTIAEAITDVNDSLASLTTPVPLTYQIMSGFADSDSTYNYVARIGKLCVFHINVTATSNRSPGNMEFIIKGLPAPAHGQMFCGFVADGSTTVKPARMAIHEDGSGSYGIRFHYPVGVTLTNAQSVIMAGSYITA